jgi:ferredoxin
VRVRVDLARCVGHGRCYELAPDLFGEDERGRCQVLRPDVLAELRDLARRAVANCPERALALEPASEATSSRAAPSERSS